MTESSALEVVVRDTLWVSERAVWFGGVRLRSKTTVVRLSEGGLWVHSPGPPTDLVCAALDVLGPVRWIVVPNRFHHLATPAMAARYPDARVVGPPSVRRRNPNVSLAMAADDEDYVGATPELMPVPLRGVPFLDETVFFHRASGSLIAADLLISCGTHDHWTWRMAARLWGRYGRYGTPPDVRLKTRASSAAAESLAQICSLPIQRILVAHADPLTDRPVERLAEAWAFASPRARRPVP
jgi:hypothetical protein